MSLEEEEEKRERHRRNGLVKMKAEFAVILPKPGIPRAIGNYKKQERFLPRAFKRNCSCAGPCLWTFGL